MTTHIVGGFVGQSPAFTGLEYDRCAYQQKLNTSTSPLSWNMYQGKFEHCKKCVYNQQSFWHPNDKEIVDAESELLGITRPATKCAQYKFLPNCKKTGFCTGTFDSANPIVMPQEVCPIVHNNIPKMKHVGYKLNPNLNCQRRQN
jgi:hypothetical protein